jgi:hypothetical protein
VLAWVPRDGRLTNQSGADGFNAHRTAGGHYAWKAVGDKVRLFEWVMLIDLVLFGTATFLGAFVTGCLRPGRGGDRLHVPTPLEATKLIVVYGLIVQGYALRKLRRTL